MRAPRKENGPKFLDKRMEVLRAAARVFARRGFHRASLGDVADELQVTPAALYYYAKSKDELLQSCGLLALEELSEALTTVRRKGQNGLDRLHMFFRFYARIICDDFGRCFVMTSVDDLPGAMQHDLIDGRQRVDREVQSMIREGIADGSIQPCDTRFLSEMLFAATHRIPHWWSPKGPLSPAQVVDEYFQILMGGIAPAREEP